MKVSFLLQTFFLILWYALVSVWVIQAWISCSMCRQIKRLIQGQRDWSLPTDKQLNLALIVPFKGIDVGMDQALKGLFNQQHKKYRLLLVVESENDPAVPMLRQAIAEHTLDLSQVKDNLKANLEANSAADFETGPEAIVEAELLIAGPSSKHEGQKVHNLIYALEYLKHDQRRYEQLDGFVFADSDAVPDSKWLAQISGPLPIEDHGCVTGYRWLFPAQANENHCGAESQTATSGNVHLASHVGSVLNSSAVTFFRRKAWSRPWGGAMAIRRDVADRGDLIQAMRGSVSDDLSLYRMVKRLNLKTYFVSQCLVRSDYQANWRQLMDFAVRQHTIIRVMDPIAFWQTFFMPWVYLAGLIESWTVVVLGLKQGISNGISHVPSICWFGLAALLLVACANQCRANLRKQTVLARFGADQIRGLKLALLIDRWFTWAWLPFHGFLMLQAACSKRIKWRGNQYLLKGPNQTNLESSV